MKILSLFALLLSTTFVFGADSEGSGTKPENSDPDKNQSCFVIFQKDADAGGGTKADSEGTGTKPFLICIDDE